MEIDSSKYKVTPFKQGHNVEDLESLTQYILMRNFGNKIYVSVLQLVFLEFAVKFFKWGQKSFIAHNGGIYLIVILTRIDNTRVINRTLIILNRIMFL